MGSAFRSLPTKTIWWTVAWRVLLTAVQSQSHSFQPSSGNLVRFTAKDPLWGVALDLVLQPDWGSLRKTTYLLLELHKSDNFMGNLGKSSAWDTAQQKSAAGEQLKAQPSQGAESKEEGSKDEPLTFTHRGLPHPLGEKDSAQSIWLVGNSAGNADSPQLQEPLLISSTSQHLPTSTWIHCQDTSCRATWPLWSTLLQTVRAPFCVICSPFYTLSDSTAKGLSSRHSTQKNSNLFIFKVYLFKKVYF